MKALVITTSCEMGVTDIDDTLDSLQAAVGGMIQALPVPGRSDATAYVNEEGKIHGLALNERATHLMRPSLWPDDYISGNLVVTGFDPATGENSDVPDELVKEWAVS